MASISVQEARAAVLPEGTILLGGDRGLSRAVSGTATLRARTPAFPALHGGELALVPLPLLRQIEPRPRLERLVAQLADAAVAAIVFLQAAGEDGELLAAAAAEADAQAVPVFVAPPQHSAEGIDAALHRHLAGHREALLRRSQEMQHELTTLALAGRGLPAVVERLAAITGYPAAWEDPLLELRGWAQPPHALHQPLPDGHSAVSHNGHPPPVDLPAILREARLPMVRWANSIDQMANSAVATLDLRANGTLPGPAGSGARAAPSGAPAALKRLVVAFSAGGRVAGYLSLIAPQSAVDQEARLALAAAGLAAAIEALRSLTVAEAQGTTAAALARDWLTGRFDDPHELASRATQLGYTPAPPYAVLVLEAAQPISPDALPLLVRAVAGSPGHADSPGHRSGAGNAGNAGRAGETGSTHNAADPTNVLNSDGGAATVVSRSNGHAAALEAPVLSAAIDNHRTALLVPLPDAAAAETAAQRVNGVLVARAAAQRDLPAIFGGVSRAAARVEDVPQAYREATQAAATAQRLGGRHRVAYFGTLGIYRILAVTPEDELASFYQDTLGPLLARDSNSGGDLLRTLEAYIASGGSPMETAQRLHTHRNTVLYRLERIVKLLGVDVRLPEQQLLLHLALRAGDVLGARTIAPSTLQISR